MIKELILQAEKGEPVWLGDVRDAFARSDNTATLTLSLTLYSGEQRIFPLRIPQAVNEEEVNFLSEYLHATVYNLLSALGGTELSFHCGGDAALTELAEGTAAEFEDPLSPYHRILRELRRICALTGAEDFHFAISDEEPEHTAAPAAEHTASLAARLQKAASAAEHGVRAGIDVGGTDIKSVLSVGGKLAAVREYDWNPASYPTAEEIIAPILNELQQMLAATGEKPDSVGLSYPDVCIRSRICGGETPKTMGIRCNPAVDYEQEFAKLTAINERLLALCKEGASIRITNDGNIAAYTAAMEAACGTDAKEIENGCLSHALGTSLGTGWVNAQGDIPEEPLEIYELIVDIGSRPQKNIEPEDLRSVRNENSRLPGADRYVGQASAFRYAYELAPELLAGCLAEENGKIFVPGDKRKACLEHLMQEAENGSQEAEEVFRRVGRAFAQVSREMCLMLQPETDTRCLFGRFVKKQRCFALIREGFAEAMPDIRLNVADESIANSPLMQQLSRLEGKTIAQFGQAIGALYFGC